MQSLLDYAKSWIGVPYKWGGENFFGVDCSGFVRQVLKSVNVCPSYDMTANGLYRYFKEYGILLDKPKAGALVFFGDEYLIRHVSLCLNGWQMIEAGGGTSSTKTRSDADASNAFVRIRPISRRIDLVGFIMPDYPSELLNE